MTDRIENTVVGRQDAFDRVRREAGLRGRQRVTDFWRDCDEWVFGTNARGGYGEPITLHYRNDAELLAVLGLSGSGLVYESGIFRAIA